MLIIYWNSFGLIIWDVFISANTLCQIEQIKADSNWLIIRLLHRKIFKANNLNR